MREKLHTGRVIVVEGKYDAARLAGLTDADILMTDGFAIYSDKERQTTLRCLAAARGLLILTDSDAAGFQIRTFLTNLAGEKNVLQAYTPAQQGKEPRKAEPGREGLLGVEGISDEVLYKILCDALRSEQEDSLPGTAEKQAHTKNKSGTKKRTVTYTDLYEWGLSGTAGAAERKAAFLKQLGLPPRLSKKELVAVLNSLYSYEELEQRAAEIPEK
jgi:ribonuclease M5